MPKIKAKAESEKSPLGVCSALPKVDLFSVVTLLQIGVSVYFIALFPGATWR